MSFLSFIYQFLVYQPLIHRFFACRVLAGCLFLYASDASSWSHRGHSGILEASFDSLTTHEKDFYNRLARDLAKSAPKSKIRDKRWRSISQKGGRFISLTAWVDAVRDIPLGELYAQFQQTIPEGLKAYEGESSSRWHYHNDFIFSDTQKHQCSLRNPGKLFERSRQLHDVLLNAGLSHGASSSGLSSEQYLITLALFLHLLEDAHQPLHTVAHVNTDCQHDRGGNLMCMKPFGRKKTHKSSCKVSLHQLWDRGFGVFDRSIPFKKLPERNAYRFSLAGVDSMLHDTYEESVDEGKRIYAALTHKDGQSIKAMTSWGAGVVGKRAEFAVSRSAEYLRYVYQHHKTRTPKNAQTRTF